MKKRKTVGLRDVVNVVALLELKVARLAEVLDQTVRSRDCEIAALREHIRKVGPRRWHPVSSVPEDGQYVLAIGEWPHNDHPRICRYDAKGSIYTWPENEKVYVKVTHWQPLPEVPKP